MLWIALRAWPEAPGSAPAALQSALACHALRYTPRVSLARDAVLMEVSASLRLFGGLAALRVQLWRELQQEMGLDDSAGLRAAAGRTSLQALARLRLNRPWRETARIPAADLPLAALDAAQAHLDLLGSLGCHRWQDLRRLPRQGVARRFGQDLLDALDQAWAERPESHQWWQVPEVFESRLQCPGGLEHAEGLLQAARHLLQHLRAWLLARSLGVLGVELVWYSDIRRSAAEPVCLPLRLSEPTQDMAHLQRLLGERLSAMRLQAPAHAVSLRSLETVALAACSGSLLPQEQRSGESLGQLLERLEARLGRTQIRCWQPGDRHEPEYMQQWLPAWASDRREGAAPTATPRTDPITTRVILPPASLAGSATAAKSGQGAGPHGPLPLAWGQLLPTWLLPQPRPLRLQGDRPCYPDPLALLVGPQRLEISGWTAADSGPEHACRVAAPVLRDYFIARSAQAGLLWIYRERKPRAQTAWFLHGIFA